MKDAGGKKQQLSEKSNACGVRAQVSIMWLTKSSLLNTPHKHAGSGS